MCITVCHYEGVRLAGVWVAMGGTRDIQYYVTGIGNAIEIPVAILARLVPMLVVKFWRPRQKSGWFGDSGRCSQLFQAGRRPSPRALLESILVSLAKNYLPSSCLYWSKASRAVLVAL